MGGNVANGSPIGDSAPVLIALGARIVLRQRRARAQMPLAGLLPRLHEEPARAGRVRAGPRGAAAAAGARSVRAYKISKRFDCDISARVRRAGASSSTASVVRGARFAFGGMAATVKRAAQAEAALRRPALDRGHACRPRWPRWRSDFTPLTDMRASAGYRLQVAQNLLQRFWLETRADDPLPRAARVSVCAAARGDAHEHSPLERCRSAPQRRGRRARRAVGVSRPHESAHLHVAGAAPYIDDLPELAGTLHAALGLSPVAHGGIEAHRPGRAARAARRGGGAHRRRHPRRQRLRPDRPRRPDPGRRAGATLRYLGQPVFAVIADHARRRAPRRGARQGRDPRSSALPPVLTPQQAHAAQPVRGAADAPARAATPARAPSPRRRTGCKASFDVGGQEQFYLEGQISLRACRRKTAACCVLLLDPAPQRDAAPGGACAAAAGARGAGGVPAHGRRLRRQGVAVGAVRLRRRGGRARGCSGRSSCAWTATTTS